MKPTSTVMETKKNERVDLYKRSGLFLSVGFVIAMLLTITAFEWRQYDEHLVDLTQRNANSFDELIDVPVTEIKPPAAPVPVPVFVPVKNEEYPEQDVPVVDIEIIDGLSVPEISIVHVEPEEATDVPFILVEDPASPVGGFSAFYAFVAAQMKGKYPVQAQRMGIQGRVFVEFIIERDGSLSDVRAIKGIGAGCDELAVKVVAASPRWNPGKQRGKPVRQRYTIPIIFKLD